MDQPQNAAAGTETRTSPAPKKKPGTGGSIADGDPSPSLAFSIEDDTDVLENELEEFYAYVEAPSIIENRVHWEQWAQSKWSSLGMDSNIGGMFFFSLTVHSLGFIGLQSATTHLTAAPVVSGSGRSRCTNFRVASAVIPLARLVWRDTERGRPGSLDSREHENGA